MRIIIKIISFLSNLFDRRKGTGKSESQQVPKDNYPMF